MRRLSLSTKLFAAALPLILAVGGLLALTVRSDLNEIDRAENGAELGGVWEPLIDALTAVEAEASALAPSIQGSDEPVVVDPAARQATDQAINDVRASIENLGAFEAASAHVTAGRSALSAARRNIDMAAIAPTMVGDIDPIDAYGIASRELVAVGQLLPSEAGDEELGRQLLAIVKLAESKLHANEVIINTSAWPNDANDDQPIDQARVAFANMVTTLGEFEAIAPDEWSAQFRESSFNTTLGAFNTSLTNVARAADAGRIETFDTAAFSDFIDQIVEFERTISESIVAEATAAAAATREATMRRIGIILAIVLVATLIAWLITRSVTRRVKAVAHSANQVAEEQLPALVEALRDPRGKAVLPDIEPVNAKGGDDLADLAKAFNSMQETLIDVAHEQVEVLRRGVSDIFITMARRNRSLIDRQLSMLDEFEAGVDDHEVLSNYYQLDHLATRMRRNSESLLVLANAEPKRRRVKATEIDDVVRASIGEVEDYRRIEIQQLESLQVRGSVVADVSHLLAELLDNATSFSPPGSAVRVGGRRAGNSYMLRIVDDGVGIGPERLSELNELLREPPIVGLSVESTLGISVVSLLANKHAIEVTLSAGSPGLTVDVILPSSLFGPMDAPAEQPKLPAADEPIVAWNEQPVADEAVATFVAADDAAAADAPPTLEPAVAAGIAAGAFAATEPDPLTVDAFVADDAPAALADAATPDPIVVADGEPKPPAVDEMEPHPVAATADSPMLETDDHAPVIDPSPIAATAAASVFGTTTAPETPGHTTVPTPDVADPVKVDPSPVSAVADASVFGTAAPAETTDPTTAAADNINVDPDPVTPAADTSVFGTAAPAGTPESTTATNGDNNLVDPSPITAAADTSVFGTTTPAVTTDPDTILAEAPQANPVTAAADTSVFGTATPAEAAESHTVAAAASLFDAGIPADDSTLEPVLEAPSAAAEDEATPEVDLPPPAPARSEFDVPPAPPITANGLAHRPVTPETARPAPVPTPAADESPALPTRTQRGTGPEGPDRLADPVTPTPADAPVGTSEPGALQAALSAFDSGRAEVNAPQAGALPTRDRGTESIQTFDEPQAVTQSRVDPSALRDRLRAFKTEFTSASDGPAGDTDIYTDHKQNDHDDLGGDPR